MLVRLQSELAKGNEKRVKLIQKYRTVVEKELDNICGEILGLLDRYSMMSLKQHACQASAYLRRSVHVIFHLPCPVVLSQVLGALSLIGGGLCFLPEDEG